MRNKETIEEVIERLYNTIGANGISDKHSFMLGVFWQQKQDKKMYSEEELELLIYNVCGTVARLQGITLNGNNIKDAFEQFKNK